MSADEFEEYSLSKAGQLIVDSLTEDDIRKVDNWLRSCITDRWQKVAMVVAGAILKSEEKEELQEVPDVFFGMRIESMAKNGEILSRGNLKLMRYSDIKRAK